MKCYYHHERDAVGSCKSCQRGLCPECAVDLTQGLACRARCEEDVAGLIRLIQDNLRLAPTSASLMQGLRRGSVNAAVFQMIFGALFLAWGLYDEMTFIIALGAAFFLFGLVSLARALRITAPKTPPEA